MRNRKGILSLFLILMLFILVACGPATKKAVTVPLPDNTAYVYTGKPITYNIERSTLYTVENSVQTNAGTYDIVISLRDKDNYAWATTTTSDDLIYKFVISPKAIAKPTVETTTYSYTGTEITFDIPTSSYYTISNNKASAAGNYTATVSLNDKTNYVWDDGTKNDLTFDFNIVNVDLSYAVIEGVNSEYVYTGSQIKPTPTVKFGNDTLVLDQDYTVRYQNNTNVGTATLTIEGKNNFKGSKAVNFSITKANPEITAPTAKTLTYNGKRQELITTGSTTGGTIKYKLEGEEYSSSIPTGINAGSYKVYYKVVGDNNYNDSAEGTIDVTIAKATYDLSNIKFENKILTYDGTEKEITISGNLPEGVTVSYENNKLTNAGIIKATAKFSGDTTNYNEISNMEATLTINKATYDMSGIEFENTTYTYDGVEKALTISGTLPEGVTVAYENNKLTNAGSTIATAKFSGNENYEVIADMTATLTINKATYDMSGIEFEDTTYTYDGVEKTITISGNLPEGVTVTYENNKLTNAGYIVATAKFSGNKNYNSIADMKAILTIEKATYDMSAVKFNNASYTYDGVEKEILISGDLPEGVTVTYKNNKLTNSGSVKATASFAGNINYKAIPDMEATLTINKAKATISKAPAKIENLVYNGTEQALITEGEVTGGSFEYRFESTNFTASIPTGTNAANYVVYYMVKGDQNHADTEEVSIEVEIAKATYDISNIKFDDLELTYNGKEQKLEITGELPTGVTVTYENNKLTDVGSTNAKAKFSVDSNYNEIADMKATLTIIKADAAYTAPKAIEGLVYNTDVQILIEAGSTSDGQMLYSTDGTNYTTNLPGGINAGDYEIYYKVEGDKNHNDSEAKTLTINIKKATPTLTAPKAIEGLVYTGSPLELVTEGLTNGGEIVYSLDDVNFVSFIPTRTNAGKYKVYYMVCENANYLRIDSNYVEVEIAKADVTIVKAPEPATNLVYNGKSQALMTEGEAIGGKLWYGVSSYYDNYWSYYSQPCGQIDVATLYVQFYVEGDENHNDYYSEKWTVTMEKATYDMSGISFDNKTVKYNGSEIEITITGTLPTGVTVTYENNKLTIVGSTVATAIFNGDYNNYNEIENMTATLTITKGDSVITKAPAGIANLVYTGDAQVLITAGETSSGTLKYKLDGEEEYSIDLPKATNAGTYKVWYKVKGDDNHEDLEELAIENISIGKADATLGAPAVVENLVYNTKAQELVTSASTTGGTVLYSTDGINYDAALPTGTNAGDYVIYYKLDGGNNYKDIAAQTINNSIAKATPVITAPTGTNPTYNGTAQILINPGSTTGGTLVYKSGGIAEEYTSNYTLIKATNAANYIIYYKVVGDDNYNDVAETENSYITSMILKATYDMSSVKFEDASYTYDGNAKSIAITGTLPDGVTVAYTCGNYPFVNATTAGTYVIKAKFEGDAANYNLIADKEAILTINKATYDMTGISFEDASYTYDGTARTIEIDGTLPTDVIVAYTCGDNPFVNATNAGTYVVKASFSGDSTNYELIDDMEATLTINKAPSSITVLPTKKELPYTGNAQVLINAGSATGGTLVYSLDGEEYSTDLPTGTEAKSYTIWYKVDGGTNYESIDPAYIVSTISVDKVDPVVTAPVIVTGLVYNEQPQELVTAGSTTGGTLVYALAQDGEYSINLPTATNAGYYDVWYKVIGDADYKDTSPKSVANCYIAKAAPTYTAPVDKNLVYTGQAQELIGAPTSSHGTFEYRLPSTNRQDAIPTGVNAGSYTVWYKLNPDNNHTGFELSITVSISKATYDMSAISFNDVTTNYDGTAKSIAISGTLPTGVTVTYNNTAVEAYSQTNAGTYPVTAKFSGDASNYNSINSMEATLTINKVDVTYTVVAAQNLVYTGQAQDLIDSFEITGGTLTYSVDGSVYSDNIPSRTDAKAYEVRYKITADANHNEVEQPILINVTIAKADASYSTTPSAKPNLVYTGAAQTLINTGASSCGTVEYSLDDNTYSTIAPKGTNATTYIVYYRLKGNSNYNDIAKSSFAVTIAKADSTYTVEPAAINNLVYNRLAQNLVTTGSSDCGQILYKLGEGEYSSTIPTGINHGQYMVYYRLVGDDNHNDIAERSCIVTIAQLELTANNTTITLAQNSYTFNNAYCTPAVSSVVVSGYTLPTTGYYQVSYENNYNAGTATVKVTATNSNYTGYVTKTFTINPKALTGATVTLEDTEFTYTGEAIRPTITSIMLDEVAITSADYTVTYPSNPSAINKGNYIVTITGKNNYTGSVTASYKVVSQNEDISTRVDMALSADSFVFNNQEQKPTVTLTDKTNNYQLIENTDYTLTYSSTAGTANIIDVGTVTVTATGMGNIYTSSISATYTITKKTLDTTNVQITLSTPTYTGQSVAPTIESAYDGNINITSLLSLTSDTPKINAGTYKAYITFNNMNKNYADLAEPIERNYTIAPKSSASLTISDVPDVPYTSTVETQGATPKVTVMDGDVTLIEGSDKDYTLSYSNNHGDDITSTELESIAYITITFRGNYSGERSKTFKIINSEFTITYVDGEYSNTRTYHAKDSTVGTLESRQKAGYTGVWSSSNGNFSFGATTVTPDDLGGNITLTAVWSTIDYSVTYYLSGGTNNEGNISTYTVETDEFTLLAPSYGVLATFVGWYEYVENQDNDDYTGTPITTIAGGTIGNIKLYAKWHYEIYDVTYVLFGGTNNANNKAQVNGNETMTLLAPSKDYYDFDGWFTTYENEVYSNQITVLDHLNDAITVYAKWSLHEYTISYEFVGPNKNNVTYTNTDHYTLDAVNTINLSNASAYTYKFEGWYLYDENYTRDNYLNNGTLVRTIAPGAAQYNIDSTNPHDITLCGVFTASNTTFVTYLNSSQNNNPGSISNNMSTVLVGAEVTATVTVNPGYTFDGWYIYQNSVETEVTTGLSNNGLTLKFDLSVDTVEYRAKFSSYTLTYSSASTTRGTVSATLNTQSFNSGDIVSVGDTVTLTASTETGYTFIGWFNNNVKVTPVTLSYDYTMTADSVVFEARWIKVNVISEDDLTLGTVNELDSTYIYGDTVNITATPVSGAIFMGWYTTNVYTGAAVSTANPYEVTMPDTDTTYYAHFALLSNKVTIAQYRLSEGVDDNSSQYRKYDLISGSTPTYVINGQTITYTMTAQANLAFAGWWTIDDLTDMDDRTLIGNSISYSCNVTISNSTTSTIYALWVSYTTHVNKSHSDSDLTYTNSCGLITDGILLTSSGPVTDNYNWVGWYDSNDDELTAELTYTMPYSYYENLVDSSSAYIPLNLPTYTAKWYQYGITVNVAPNANSQTGGGAVNKTYTTSWTITATSDNGFRFIKWQHDGSDFEGNNVATLTNIAGASGTYTAIFDLDTVDYTINYHFEHYADDGYDIGMYYEYTDGIIGGYRDITLGDLTGITYDQSVLDSATIPSYYEFKEAKANGSVINPTSGTTYRLNITIGDGTDSLDFYYTLKRVSVTYYYNDGTHQTTTDSNVKYNKTTSDYPLQTGYAWYTDMYLDSQTNVSSVAYSTNTYIVYACYNGNNDLSDKFIIGDYDATETYIDETQYYRIALNPSYQFTDIVIPNYIADVPVRKFVINNLSSISYTSITMPSQLTYFTYGEYNDGNDIQDIDWIILSENSGTYKLLSKNSLASSTFANINTILANIQGVNETKELLTKDQISSPYTNIVGFVISGNWWTSTTENYNPIIPGAWVVTDNSSSTSKIAQAATAGVRPTITITIPTSNTAS